MQNIEKIKICKAARIWLNESKNTIEDCEPGNSTIRKFLPWINVLINSLDRPRFLKTKTVQHIETCCINLNEIFKEDCSYLTDFETILNK